MVRVYGPSQMHLTYLFGAAGVTALFWHVVGPLAWVPLAVVLLSTSLVRVMRDEVWRMLSTPSVAASGALPAFRDTRDGEHP